MREQHDLGLAAETRPDIGRRLLPKHLAGQILRRIQQRGRRRRHDRPDIGAGPDHLLRAGERRRIDRRDDHRANLRVQRTPHLLDHHGGDRCWLGRPVYSARGPSPPVQPRGDALHELAFVVLRESQTFRSPGGGCRPARSVEGRENDRPVMPGGPSCADQSACRANAGQQRDQKRTRRRLRAESCQCVQCHRYRDFGRQSEGQARNRAGMSRDIFDSAPMVRAIALTIRVPSPVPFGGRPRGADAVIFHHEFGPSVGQALQPDAHLAGLSG